MTLNYILSAYVGMVYRLNAWMTSGTQTTDEKGGDSLEDIEQLLVETKQRVEELSITVRETSSIIVEDDPDDRPNRSFYDPRV